ncbi:MAG TPA: helix-turn-helix domain-containing protein [Longimicrobium sp.]|nr:helix-turn-helix domain-containing protein [Longimicrobium sp.]
MVHVVALLPDARAQKRLADALALRERAWSPCLEFATGWSEVHARAAAAAPELLVFDPYADGRFDGESVASFAGQFRSCVLVGYSAFPRGSARDVLELSRAGAHDVVTQDVDDARQTLAERLDRALESGAFVHAVSLLERRCPPPVRHVLPRVLFRTRGALTPPQAARLCHCHPKTLRAYLRAAGLPSLGRLIVWTRLIRACCLLQDPGRSVESVARVLGFASANGLRNQMLRYVGVCPTGLRGPGRLERVLDRFQTALDRKGAAANGSPACDPVLETSVSRVGRPATLAA